MHGRARGVVLVRSIENLAYPVTLTGLVLWGEPLLVAEATGIIRAPYGNATGTVLFNGMNLDSHVFCLGSRVSRTIINLFR